MLSFELFQRFAEASAVDPSALTVGGEDPRQSYQGAVLGTEQVAGGPSASMEDSNPHQAATDFVQQGPTGFYPLGKAVQKERWHVRVGSFHDDAYALLC